MGQNVAQLVQTLGTGGAEKLVVDIAAARARAGDTSHIIVLGQRGGFASHIPENVPLHRLGLNPRNPFLLLRTVFRLLGLCRRLRLEVVQSHLPMANFFGLVLAWFTGIGVFPTVHNNREFAYGQAANPLRSRWRRWAYRRLVVSGRRMIAVSDAVKAAMVAELKLNDHLAARLVVVPNGVAVPPRVDPGKRLALRQGLGVPPGAVLIIGVGRLTEQKNFRDLLTALARLDAGCPDWLCLVAGTGPLEADLRSQAEELGLAARLTWAGRVDDIDSLLAAADVFCMPSLWEGLPLALLEAMAAGLPVAAYAIDGVREVVVSGENGFLSASGDTSGLAGDLKKLMVNEALRERLGQSARRLIREHHSMDRVSARLQELYNEERE